MTEWDKLWKEKPIASNELKASDYTLTRYGKWIKQVKAVGDKREQRIKELEQENKQLKTEHEGMRIHIDKLEMKLEAIRGIVAEYPTCDKNGLAFDWDELITRILAVLDGPAQNTDYVQKEIEK